MSRGREGEREMRRRLRVLRFRLRGGFVEKADADGAREGEDWVSCSKEAMRRLVVCALVVVGWELFVGIIVGSGIEVVRMWIGRNGFLSLRGDNGGACGAMDVGVVDALGETAAEEKWSDGEAGSYGWSWCSCPCAWELILSEEI